MTYLLKTTATMKPHNSKKYWIDGGIVPEITVDATCVDDVMSKYREIISDRHYITVSDSALKHCEPMYTDAPDGTAIQCGYALTAKTDIDGTQQYIELWVTVLAISNPFVG